MKDFFNILFLSKGGSELAKHFSFFFLGLINWAMMHYTVGFCRCTNTAYEYILFSQTSSDFSHNSASINPG